MKPKNKFQQRVMEASRCLPKITPAQVRWAKKNCIQHIGRRNAKGVITCTECGHSWQGDGYLVDTLTECRCPHCDTALKVETTRKSKFNDYEYLCIVTTCGEFQVLRFLYVECWMKAGETARYAHQEVIQRWIAPDGRHATVARLRPMGYFVHGWSWTSPLEIRPEKQMYNIVPTRTYPRKKLIPELARCGYDGAFLQLTAFDVMKSLLSQPKAETLLKAGYQELFQFFIYNSREVNDYWHSIRIAIRNSYRITDAHAWVDYIDLLRFFGRDLRNTHYVCPADLHREHDRYVAKRQAFHERQEIERKLEQAKQWEDRFREMKARFFGIEFTDGVISVRVIESVAEMMVEGVKMHHCVGGYHDHDDSLILSATLGGERLETVEFSLSRLMVVQCRGVCNGTTPYHKRIIDLVNRNIPAIRQRLAA
jgi:predicted metal-binding protein